MPNIIWTDEEKALIRAERAKTPPTPVPTIAAMLGRPVPATYNRCRMIKVLIEPHAPWTTAQVEALINAIKENPSIRDIELAAITNHPESAIRWKVGDLKIQSLRQLRPAPRPKAVKPVRTRAIARPEKTAAVTKTINVRVQAPVVAKPFDVTKAFRKILEKKSRVKAKRNFRAVVIAVKPARLGIALQIAPVSASTAPFDVTNNFRKHLDKKPRVKTKKRVLPVIASVNASQLGIDLRGLPTPAVVLASGSSSTGPNVIASGTKTVTPLIVCASVPKAQPAAQTTPAKTSGRGGWKTTGYRRLPSNNAPIISAADLSAAAADAVAQFIAERGVTRHVQTESDAIIAALQRRDYVVLQVAKDTWMIDHRHEIKGADKLAAFASQRGMLNIHTAA